MNGGFPVGLAVLCVSPLLFVLLTHGPGKISTTQKLPRPRSNTKLKTNTVALYYRLENVSRDASHAGTVGILKQAELPYSC